MVMNGTAVDITRLPSVGSVSWPNSVLNVSAKATNNNNLIFI
jgi:hypothetical protein